MEFYFHRDLESFFILRVGEDGESTLIKVNYTTNSFNIEVFYNNSATLESAKWVEFNNSDFERLIKISQNLCSISNYFYKKYSTEVSSLREGDCLIRECFGGNSVYIYKIQKIERRSEEKIVWLRGFGVCSSSNQTSGFELLEYNSFVPFYTINKSVFHRFIRFFNNCNSFIKKLIVNYDIL